MDRILEIWASKHALISSRLIAIYGEENVELEKLPEYEDIQKVVKYYEFYFLHNRNDRLGLRVFFKIRDYFRELDRMTSRSEMAIYFDENFPDNDLSLDELLDMLEMTKTAILGFRGNSFGSNMQVSESMMSGAKLVMYCLSGLLNIFLDGNLMNKFNDEEIEYIANGLSDDEEMCFTVREGDLTVSNKSTFESREIYGVYYKLYFHSNGFFNRLEMARTTFAPHDMLYFSNIESVFTHPHVNRGLLGEYKSYCTGSGRAVLSMNNFSINPTEMNFNMMIFNIREMFGVESSDGVPYNYMHTGEYSKKKDRARLGSNAFASDGFFSRSIVTLPIFPKKDITSKISKEELGVITELLSYMSEHVDELKIITMNNTHVMTNSNAELMVFAAKNLEIFMIEKFSHIENQEERDEAILSLLHMLFDKKILIAFKEILCDPQSRVSATKSIGVTQRNSYSKETYEHFLRSKVGMKNNSNSSVAFSEDKIVVPYQEALNILCKKLDVMSYTHNRSFKFKGNNVPFMCVTSEAELYKPIEELDYDMFSDIGISIHPTLLSNLISLTMRYNNAKKTFGVNTIVI